MEAVSCIPPWALLARARLCPEQEWGRSRGAPPGYESEQGLGEGWRVVLPVLEMLVFKGTVLAPRRSWGCWKSSISIAQYRARLG